MKKKLMLEDDRYCFVCGERNPRGLRLNLVKNNQEIITYITIEKWMQGYKDIAHGGFIALILDEMIVNACYLNGYKAVSAEYTVRLKKPCFVGQEVKFSGRLLKIRKNVAFCKSWAVTGKEIVAEAEGKCIILKED